MKPVSRIYNLLRGFHATGVFSRHIRIDVCTFCQLKCPVCFQQDGTLDYIKRGCLSLEKFKTFVEAYPTFNHFELSHLGEIFLNPELEDIIRYAHEKHLLVSAWNGSNLNSVRPATLEALVKYQFEGITVSLDGASPQVYQIYRIGGDFNQVIENIKTINKYKVKYHSEYPRLIWQFIVFGHNEHEIPHARQMARELNMIFQVKFNIFTSYSPLRDFSFVKEQVGPFLWNKWQKENEQSYGPHCKQLWFEPQINWDGRLLGCCLNFKTDFGNVFETDLKSCIQSARYVYMKQMLCGKQKDRPDIPCLGCSARTNMRYKILNEYYRKIAGK